MVRDVTSDASTGIPEGASSPWCRTTVFCRKQWRHWGRPGVDLNSVNVLTGPEGAHLLDRSGREHGLRGRLTRILQRGAFENEALQLHEAMLRSGGSVVYVPTHGQPQRDQVASLLRNEGATALLHFRRWSIEPL
jgi:hypothetical protein